MSKICIMFLLAMVICGCAKVSHLDQLLTLKGLADEQDLMGEYIDAQDEEFELMLDEMKAGTLDQYLNKRKIVRAFGDPIFVKTIERNEQQLEVWLYRYAAEFFGSEKIYLYFDSDENLVDSEYFEGSNG